MDYWKSKVLPKMKLIFVKTGSKKAAEVVKAFDESKEGINGEFEEKKADLQPKAVQIYESVTTPVKILIKERKKTSAIKKNSAAITNLFEDLAKIEFPGAKQVSEGIATVGPALLSGPIFATFEKVSTLLPATATEADKEQSPKEEEKKDEAATEEKKEEAAAEEKKEEAKKEEATAAVAEEAAAPAAAAAEPVAAAAAEEEETSSSAAPPADQAAPEAAATPAETESAPEKAEEAPKQAA